jgi:MFS transporter, PAT family, solute carrier family 33 (acetyl-CoA transportor), member 1
MSTPRRSKRLEGVPVEDQKAPKLRSRSRGKPRKSSGMRSILNQNNNSTEMDLESGIRDDDANMKLIQREYLPGEQVTYIKGDASDTCTIKAIHRDDYPNLYYTISYYNKHKGEEIEKQTDQIYLKEIPTTTTSSSSSSSSFDLSCFASIPYSEKISLLLLFVLYTLQGLPMGLCMSLPVILKERGASYNTLTMISIASLPFSLKLLWAPLVDTVFIKKFGRRKTWLVPIQLLTGILLIHYSSNVVEWLGGDVGSYSTTNAGADGGTNTDSILNLTFFFTFIYFLMATQDIAVDGWALTMLSNDNVGYASTCNSIGQNLGAFISNQGFISLSDPSWCHRMLGTPIGYAIANLSSFMKLSGITFIIITLVLVLLKKEKPLPSNEEPSGIRETYEQIFSLLKLSPVQSLLLVLLTYKLSFAPADSVAQFKMQEYGMPKTDYAMLSPITLIISLILPALVANWANRDPLGAISWALPWKLLTTGVYWFLVKAVPYIYLQEGSADTQESNFFNIKFIGFYLGLLLIMISHVTLDSVIFCSFMSFFNKISDPAIGGTYMTFLNSASNLGFKWTNSLAIWATGQLTFRGHSTIIDIDGYTVVTFLCVIYGIFWLFYIFPIFKRLNNVKRSDWMVRRSTTVTGTGTSMESESGKDN